MIKDIKGHFLNKMLRFLTIYSSVASVLIAFGIFLFYYFGKDKTNSEKEFIIAAFTAIAIMLGAALAVLAKYTIYQKRKAKVFISYTELDIEFVRKLSKDLVKENFEPILIDNVILIGDNIKEGIEGYIKNSDLFIIIVSHNYKSSEFLKKELTYAMENKKKIFPILINDGEIPNELSSIKCADFRKEYREQLNLLIKSLLKNI